MIHIACDLEENIKRIQSPERKGKRKLQGAEVVRRNHASSEPLIGSDLPYTFRLNVTNLKPEEAADRIANHCNAVLAATRAAG